MLDVLTFMKYGWVEDPATIQALIHDDFYVMEQKMDGTRGMAVLRYGQSPVMRAGSGPLKHTAATQWLPQIWNELRPIQASLNPGEQIILDGEIMIHSGEYRLFDLPYMDVENYLPIDPDRPFAVRRDVLEQLAARLHPNGVVRLVYQAQTSQTKTDLYVACEREGVEGVMLKHLAGQYRPGERTDEVLKVKFVKTADVVVLGSSRSRNAAGRETGSFTLGVTPPAEWDMTADQQLSVTFVNGSAYLPVGNCSAIGKPPVSVGDVIEVAYLYWTGGSLYQPRMVRRRDDKHPAACDMSQFLPYSRTAVK